MLHLGNYKLHSGNICFRSLNHSSCISPRGAKHASLLCILSHPRHCACIMSDDEDDYLSDKFLASLEAASKPSAQKSYLQRRDEAKRRSERLQLENRMKSRREREEEAREEVLSKTLFERAEEDKQKGIREGNKALSMMMKMGFKPGQALGDKTTWEPEEESLKPSRTGLDMTTSDEPPSSSTKPAHRIEPLPLNEWMGECGPPLFFQPRTYVRPMHTHHVHDQERRVSV
jgi:hypothetical protein